MKDMIPVFREGSLGPLDHENLEPRWRPAPMATYEAVPTEGLGDLPSCLRKLQVGQKMLFHCSPVQAANAARNASAYGMHMRTHKSKEGMWIGRRA